MSTYSTQGTTFEVQQGGVSSPDEYITIGNVRSASGPSGSRALIDVTNLSSTAREFNAALKDMGEFVLECQYDPDDTGQARCKTLFDASNTTDTFRVSLTDSPATTMTFTGYVTGWEVSMGIDDVYLLTITIKITGDVTIV